MTYTFGFGGTKVTKFGVGFFFFKESGRETNGAGRESSIELLILLAIAENEFSVSVYVGLFVAARVA